MKKFVLTVIALSLFVFNSNAENETVVKSKINKVTVYTQGAQVQRKASYSVSKGISTLVIEGISPNIDPNSLQVQATGDIIILDSKYTALGNVICAIVDQAIKHKKNTAANFCIRYYCFN